MYIMIRADMPDLYLITSKLDENPGAKILDINIAKETLNTV